MIFPLVLIVSLQTERRERSTVIAPAKHLRLQSCAFNVHSCLHLITVSVVDSQASAAEYSLIRLFWTVWSFYCLFVCFYRRSHSCFYSWTMVRKTNARNQITKHGTVHSLPDITSLHSFSASVSVVKDAEWWRQIMDEERRMRPGSGGNDGGMVSQLGSGRKVKAGWEKGR